MYAHPQKFSFFENISKITKNWAMKLRYVLAILLKLYFLLSSFECVNESWLCYRSTLNVYKIKNLLLETS